VAWKTIEDGNDLVAVCEAMAEAIERARSGGGPTLIEFMTYRIAPHHTGDPCVYRKKEEVESWKKKDPIQKSKVLLTEAKLLNEEMDQKIRSDAQAEIEEAIRWMEESPFPDPEEALEGVFA
jgi:TPP-dependent pyruvate/acetoin dehydrogenase alpha subunit